MGSIGASRSVSTGSYNYNTNDFTLTSGNTNNVKRALNALDWRRPMFVDKVTHGYRVRLSQQEDVANELAKKIKDKTGIEVQVRRGGPGRRGYDAIIPFATDDEKLEYTGKR